MRPAKRPNSASGFANALNLKLGYCDQKDGVAMVLDGVLIPDPMEVGEPMDKLVRAVPSSLCQVGILTPPSPKVDLRESVVVAGGVRAWPESNESEEVEDMV